MQHIYLIRHGQASFGAENYDKLSDLGKRQASAIGDYFSSQEITIERIIHGKMSRQQETAEIIAKQAGFDKSLILHEGANEFDSENLIKHYLPLLAMQSEELNNIMQSGEDWWATGENFELFFRALVTMWQQDDNCPFESWVEFKDRCINCLTDIAQMNQQRKKEKGITLLATSGGLISVTMQSILSSENNPFNNQAFMDMNLTINNTSISEVVWQANHSVDSINSVDDSINLVDDSINLVDDSNNKHILKNRNRLLSFNNITPLLLTKKSELITRK